MNKMNAQQKMIVAFASKRGRHIPILRTVCVLEGVMGATDRDIRLNALCDLPDGVYTPEAIKVAEVVGGDPVHSEFKMEDYPLESAWCKPGEVRAELVLDADAMERVKRVSLAMADRDARYYLNGVMFDLGAGVCVATDGRRLHKAPMPDAKLSSSVAPEVAGAQAIIPREFITFLLKQKTAHLFFTSNRVMAQCPDGLSMVSKLIDGKFPEYKRVIPTERSPVALPGFRDAVAQAKTLWPTVKKIRGTKALVFHKDVLELRGILDGERYMGAPLDGVAPVQEEYGFDPQYLIDAVAALEPDLRLLFGTTTGQPLLLEDNTGMQVVVMPLRV